MSARKRFSDRIGITTPPTTPQLEEMTDELRASLWNTLDAALGDDGNEYYKFPKDLIVNVASGFRRVPVDTIDLRFLVTAKPWLRDYFFRLEWWGVYNLLEFLLHGWDAFSPYKPRVSRTVFGLQISDVLEREISGYRVMGSEFVPITSPEARAAIGDALTATRAEKLQGAHKHFEAALTLLSRKPVPDNRNAIKEAISAVESTAKVLSGVTSGGLKDAIKALKSRGLSVHRALETGLLNIYGYTSDGDGIRHALLEGSEPDADDARFMVVACAAFVNFLIAKSTNLKPA